MPWSSIVPPLYKNDLPCALKCSKVKMYADDTSLAQSANDIKDIDNVMNSELENLKEWLHSNKLSLNVTKATSIPKQHQNRSLMI